MTVRRTRRPGRFLTGPAGPGPAWALAAVALLGAFVAAAGPREFVVLQDRALRQDATSAGSFGIAVTTSWQIPAQAAPGQLPASRMQLVGRSIGGQIRPPLVSPPARRWSGLTTAFLAVANPAPQSVLSAPPGLEVAYRSNLMRNARLVAGSLPQAVRYVTRAGQRAVVVGAAVTAATAARFGLRPGSQVSLAAGPPLAPTDVPVVLRITGIIAPSDPASSFWTADPVLAAPIATESAAPAWQGGVLVGPAGLPAVEDGFAGSTVTLSWNYPLDTSRLTAPQVPGYLQAMTTIQTDQAGIGLGSGLPDGSNASVTVSADGAGTLGDFETEQAAVGPTDSLSTVGIFAVALILLLVCALVLADAYRAELSLFRARGGSSGQVAARVAARCAGAAGPALAAGTLLAVLVTPGGATPVSWLLTAAVVVTTMAAPPLLAAWRHRGPAVPRAGRDDLAVPRRSARRLVAEIAAIAAIAGGVVALRQRGLAPGTGVDPYVSSAPVLVALAAGLIVARVYPVPLRAVLRLTSRRRSAVGYLGLARAARSRSGSLLPALALAVALAVIALGVMVRAAVSRGQVATSWQQVGADAVVQAQQGRPSIGPAARRAIASVPGVGRASVVYTVDAGSTLAANLLVGTGGSVPTGVVIVNPARYAALAADTPWPAFPAGLLARAGPGGTARDAPVPVLASPDVAASVRAGSDLLAFASSQITIRVAAVIAATPAMPGGGSFIVLPDWARTRLRAGTAPNTMLLTGARIDVHALRAAAARYQPGSRVVSRAGLLAAAAGSPSVRGSGLLIDLCTGAGAACCAAAVLLGLLLSGRDRTRLAAWLTALGMTQRQARRLAVLDPLPMLLIATAGAELAGAAGGVLIAPALDLSALTGSGAPVSVPPSPAALILPPAGLIVLAVVITAGQSVLTRRAARTGVLRLDEGR